MKILVINAGSSSLKYQLIDMDNEQMVCKGNCERIGMPGGIFTHKTADGRELKKNVNMLDHAAAFMQVKNALIQQTVLLQEAKKAKLESRADVKEAINAAREQVLINALIQDWAKANPVSDKDVKAAYDRQKAAYGDTEYQVRHILVKTEEQAKNLIKRLGNKGANFDKLAEEFSEDTGNKNQGGLLGWVVPRSYPAAFGVAFSALKPGEVAQTPIRTQYGFHVVKLDAKRPAQLFPAYESQAPQLKNALTNQRMQQHFLDLAKKAKVE